MQIVTLSAESFSWKINQEYHSEIITEQMLTRSALLYLSRQEGLKDFAARFRPFRK